MAGASKKRAAREKAAASNNSQAEHRSTPPSVVSVPIPGLAGPSAGPLSHAGSTRPSPAANSARGSSASNNQSSLGLPSLGARFDGNTSRAASPAPGSRPASPGPAARGPSSVDAKNLDLGAAAWASINNLTSTNLPSRPATMNTNGQEVTIGLNSYKVLSYPTTKVYQYDVLILPHGATKVDGEVKRVVLNKVWKSKAVQTQLPPGFIYDGNKLAWCLSETNQIRAVVDLDQEREPDKPSKGRNQFKFQLRYSTTVNFNSLDSYLVGRASWSDQCLEAIAFLDHLMRETPRTKFHSFRRSFFSHDNKRLGLGGGVEAFKGVYASIRCAYHGPNLPRSLSVNVDVSNGTFWVAGPLIQAMMAVCNVHDVNAFQMQYRRAVTNWHKSPLYDNLKRLRRVKVWSQHRGVREEFTIDKILNKTADEYSFTQDDGASITLRQYFVAKYRQSPQTGLPVIQMMRKVGPPGKKTNIVLPVDTLRLCEYQRYAYKLSDTMTSSMIKFAVTLPHERMAGIETGVKSLSWGTDPYLKNYGVNIDTKRTEVKARLLPAPDVVFANGSIPASQAGQGRWRIDGKKFATPNRDVLKAWGVCVVQDRGAPDQQATIAFFKNFMQTAKGHGLAIADGPPVIAPGNLQQGGEMITHIWNATGNKFNARPQILFFILPRKDTILYRSIKKSCDVRYGVVSQCLQAAHVLKNQAQYISNVCLKVNAKLGGSTTARPGSKLMPRLNPKAATIPTMIIGADVSHAAPGIDDQGSMAAITVSMNRELTRFAAHVQTNGRRVELIMERVWDELEPMFNHWIKTVGNGQLPQRLIYLRDGLSEGQYQQCLDSEVGYLRSLLKRIQPGNTVQMTVIICSKRHHVRFFPSNSASGDRNGNPKPGTLVETGVTHPFENDFYLCSHSAIKGTARPIHFHVLKNDCQMSPAEMHQMMYESSYTYARATTPVSLPPAVYYAHLASNRAIAHINQPAQSSGKKEEATQQHLSSGSHTSLPEIAPLMGMNNAAQIRASMWYI